MPLYTGRVNGCVGSPLKLTDLPSVPFWLWGRMVARAPPASRCVTPRLQLPSPYRPFPDHETVCHSRLIVLPSAWNPAVASDAPSVREQMTPHQARSQFLGLSLAVKLATSCRSNGRSQRRVYESAGVLGWAELSSRLSLQWNDSGVFGMRVVGRFHPLQKTITDVPVRAAADSAG
jgi:hypothetical protein